ncbi:MAG: RimJ/RimL family protein N-acetyltransferase [Salibacteraceae bacterium]|jgi:RimJ/RimL family protein N-acetyltransferase
MIVLKPFNENDFDTFKSWIHSDEELFQFAGPILSYPLTDDQLRSYIKMIDKKPLKVVLISTNETIGHCELNFENGNNRLCRILIGKKELRGKQIGEQIVRKMVHLLFQDQKINEVDLNVFDWNKGAINCYKKVGFKINHNNTSKVTVNGNVWTKLNLTLKR